MTLDQSTPQLIKRLRWYDSLEQEGKSALAFELDDQIDRALKKDGYVIGAGWARVKLTSAGKAYLTQYETSPKAATTSAVRPIVTRTPLNHRPLPVTPTQSVAV